MPDEEGAMSLREQMAAAGVFEHPELGFCKLGEVSTYADGTLRVPIIPVTLVLDVVVDTKA